MSMQLLNTISLESRNIPNNEVSDHWFDNIIASAIVK